MITMLLVKKPLLFCADIATFLEESIGWQWRLSFALIYLWFSTIFTPYIPVAKYIYLNESFLQSIPVVPRQCFWACPWVLYLVVLFISC
jgi:hypothetical protein